MRHCRREVIMKIDTDLDATGLVMRLFAARAAADKEFGAKKKNMRIYTFGGEVPKPVTASAANDSQH